MSSQGGGHNIPTMNAGLGVASLEHYFRLLLHRKWLILGIWLLVSLVTVLVVYRLKDVYTSDTVILVDPQKVPESYVKSTVTGDVRNRLGTLSQQILSSTRLQQIIEKLNLYPEDRKAGMAREDVITKMRTDISVHVVSDFGASQDLQAFRITYSGKDPRLVALVANQLATLFIEENLKARELQATGTTDFLSNQLTEAGKKLKEQESRLKDFRLKHVGEMPEQQTADLNLLAQAQTQLQMETDAANRAEQQKSYIQSLMAQSAPVVDVDTEDQKTPKGAGEKGPPPADELAKAKIQLQLLESRYTEDHPEVKKLKRLIEEGEAKQAKAAAAAPTPAGSVQESAALPAQRPTRAPANHFNPVLQSQLKALESEIEKHNEEQQRLSKVVTTYRSKLDAIPVREQEIAELQRDYEESKNHYSQLLNNQLSAQTATQLEIRQKGEKFEVLDPAQPAERPSWPPRTLINIAGSIGGLILGLLVASGKEFVEASVITPQDLMSASGLPVLGEIPLIRTEIDRRLRLRRILIATTSLVIVGLACGALLYYHYRIQI
jgi:succinoglycan biosynthesis transport protein ExoP